MNITNIIELFIGSIFLNIYYIVCGKGALSASVSKTVKSFVVIFLLSIFITVNYMFLDNAARLVTLYLVVLFFYKILFNKNIAQCAIAALISYLFLVIGEILFMLVLTSLYKLRLISDIGIFTGSIVANFFITIVSYSLFKLIERPVSRLLSKVKENSKFTLIFTFMSILIAIGSLAYKMAFSNWKIDNALLTNMIITVCLVYIGGIIIKQHVDKIKISDDYEDYIRYSKDSEKLVEQYSISQHENQNELIVIRSMVHKNNKKLIEYLDEIISNKDNIESSWIKCLTYIPFGGLKGIFHNKISYMKEKGINVFLNVSKEVGKSKLKDLTMKENNLLSKIIGVFLDNAREAAMNSKDKEVSICVYMEEDKIVFEISNTFAGDVNLDNIYDSGYSSKGKNRGYGLSVVKTIVDENNIFKNETEITKGYFVQRLIVNKTK